MSDLLTDMYPLAVQRGIPSDEYWEKTLEEILVQVDANQQNKQQEVVLQANLDYRMVQMIAYAVNEPQKMPNFEDAYPFTIEANEVSEEEKALLEMKRDQGIMLANIAQIQATRARKQAKNKQ